MIFIAHRGNISGKISHKENSPEYIVDALNKGFYVEIDLWKTENGLYLGHDNPDYPTNKKFVDNPYFFVHCKNIEALSWCIEQDIYSSYFWHEEDHCTLTSKQQIWVYPGKKLISGCIAVMPEIAYDGMLEKCYGICTDYAENAKQDLNFFL